ncbi:hypothetical protein J6590_075257 [Homalodisca vitripennis]|nr:hypothetical protein J6590_075257 [Homalodisca vitripennis]
MVYTYRHRKAVLGLTTHGFSTRAPVGRESPCHRDDCEPGETKYVVNSFYRCLPPVTGTCGPNNRTNCVCLRTTTYHDWLRMVGFDNAESLLIPTYRY